MNTDLKLVKWERRKKAQFMPSPPRSGFTVASYKNKAFFFGGVSDEESEETIDSVCHDDLFVYSVDVNRWYVSHLVSQARKHSLIDVH